MGVGKRMTGWEAVLLGVLGALVSVLAVGLAADPASAGNWRGHDAGGRNINFQMCNLSNNTHDAFRNNGDHDIGPTNIIREEVYGCNVYDVFINDFEYGTDDYRGWWECHLWSDANTCDHSHAHINKSWPSIPEDYGVTLSVVCEEIGHSVGLAHNRGESDSCMYDENYGARHLTGHDKYMINQHY